MFQIAAAGGFFVVLIGCLMILGPKSFASANGCIEDYTGVAGWPVFLSFHCFLLCRVERMLLIAAVDDFGSDLIGFQTKVPRKSFAAASKCING